MIHVGRDSQWAHYIRSFRVRILMDLGKKIHLLGSYRVGGEEVFCYFLVYDTILVHASYYGDNLVGSFLGGVFIKLPICVLVCQVFETFGHIVISIQHHYGRSFVSLLD